MTTPAEAAEHLERVWNEGQRLKLHFSQRSQQEKKQMGKLEALVPKLKRMAKGGPGGKADVLSKDELAVLEGLKPKKA